MSKIQNEDVKSLAQLTAASGVVSQLINDTKIYVTGNSLNEQLSAGFIAGDIHNKEVASLIKEQSSPSTPASGYVKFYAKTDRFLYWKDDLGVETQLGAAASGSSSTDHGMLSIDNTAGDVTIATGKTLTYPYLNIQSADTYTVSASAQLVGVTHIIVGGTLTVNSGGEVRIL